MKKETDTTERQWLDTPPTNEPRTHGRQGATLRFREQLERHAGQWTSWRTYDKPNAAYAYTSYVNHGHVQSFVGCRAEVRRRNGRFEVWMTYPGDVDNPLNPPGWMEVPVEK